MGGHPPLTSFLYASPMLDFWQLVVLAIIQGLTEFLPVSSSAHLILPSEVLGWPDQGVLIDVMAHFGSLFAVLIYFREDVARIILGLLDMLRRTMSRDAALALALLIATPPALVFGVLLEAGGITEMLRSWKVIAATSIGFGILLLLADIWGPRTRTTEDIGWKDAALMGLAQAVALIPGTSRSGITMTAGRGLGLTRVEAARFSMLMGIPVIAAGGLYSLLKLATGEAGGATLGTGLAVAVLSFIAAYAAIALFMRWVPRIGMGPFALYRILLGALLIVMFL